MMFIPTSGAGDGKKDVDRSAPPSTERCVKWTFTYVLNINRRKRKYSVHREKLKKKNGVIYMLYNNFD